jgi:serine phosphatase RsbU (regulator of sigma subunit)
VEFSDIESRASQAPPGDLPAILAEAGQAAGIRSLDLYLVDYGQTDLELVGDVVSDGRAPVRMAVSGTPAGQAFATRQVVMGPDPDGATQVWVPLVERDETLGVLLLQVAEATPLDELTKIGSTAGALVRLASRYTDLYERHRQRAEMNLAAEMQWELLPSLAFAAPGIRINGVLEPAYEIGGDAFDYSLNGGIGHVAIFDAMGHGLEATQTASLALGAYRYCRRKQMSLAETATTIDVAVRHMHAGEVFVTGHLLEVDLSRHLVRWINAGHPDPLHLRAGRVLAEPHIEPWVPFGLDGPVGEIGELSVDPGDSLLLFSDGAPEARPDGGDQFGRARLIDAVHRLSIDDSTPARLLRGLVEGVLAHRMGELEDDVTFVVIGIEG